MSSQRHKRDIHGYDAEGNTPYTLGEKRVPSASFTDDLAGQSVNFKTYFPTGTNFALGSIPAGMSLNASTGVLNGTPTTVSSASTTLTVTYTAVNGPVVKAVPWSWAVVAA